MRRNWGFMSLQNSSKVLKYGGCRLKILLGFFCFLNFFLKFNYWLYQKLARMLLFSYLIIILVNCLPFGASLSLGIY